MHGNTTANPHARHPRAPLWLLAAAIGLIAVGSSAIADDGQLSASRLAVEGTREQIGTAIGKATADDLKRLHPQFVAIAVAMCGEDKETLYKRTAKIAPHIRDEDVVEMRATARAAGLAYEDILFLNCFYTLTTRHTMACTQLVAWDKATKNGRLIHARNLDWFDYPGRPLNKNHLILNVKPKDGHAYVTLTWPGLMGVLTGTNEKGITVAFNQYIGGDRVNRLAEPTFLIIRRILATCDSVDEAVKMLTDAKPLDDGGVTISDAGSRKAVVVEVVDGRVGVRAAKKGEPLIASGNHCTPETKVRGRTRVPITGADWPALYVARRLEQPFDVKDMHGIMAHRFVMQPHINMMAAVFLPDENRMLLSLKTSHAARGKFTEYKLFPDKAKGVEKASDTPPADGEASALP